MNAEAFVLALGRLASVLACHRGDDLCLSDKEIRIPCYRMSLFIIYREIHHHVIGRRRLLFSQQCTVDRDKRMIRKVFCLLTRVVSTLYEQRFVLTCDVRLVLVCQA